MQGSVVLESPATCDVPPCNDERIQVQQELKTHSPQKQLHTDFSQEERLGVSSLVTL